MPPSVKGKLWPLFHREDTLVDVGATVYARCKPCTAELSLAAVSASGLDKDDLEAPSLEADAVHAEFEIYAMDNLPDENDHDIPQDNMSSFQSRGGSLAELFDVSVVGKLAPP
jgi:hypothetical protein